MNALWVVVGLRTYTEEFGESVMGFFRTYGLENANLPPCRDPCQVDAGLSDYELFMRHCTLEKGGDRYLVGDLYEDVPCMWGWDCELLRPRSKTVWTTSCGVRGSGTPYLETGRLCLTSSTVT